MDKNKIVCLGISGLDDVYLFSRQRTDHNKSFRIDKSSDGLIFEKVANTEFLLKEFLRNPIFQDFRLSKINEEWVLICRVIHEGTSGIVIAKSKDLKSWKSVGRIISIQDSATIVSDHKHEGNYIMYAGGNKLKVLYSKDLQNWFGPYLARTIPLKTNNYVIVASANLVSGGILVIYFLAESSQQIANYSVRAMMFDKHDPEKALWSEPRTIMHAHGHKLPIGVTESRGSIVSYWQRGNGELHAINHGKLSTLLGGSSKLCRHPKLRRYDGNPVLEPTDEYGWQSEAVFNPAAVCDEGKVHLLYRAVGRTNTSVWGHAESTDGVNFDSDSHPVYTPTRDFEGVTEMPNTKPSSKYVSGPGWGGCEDPRAVIIEGNIYVTYVAFDGCNPQRVALTSMRMDDFRSGSWEWASPTILSPPGQSNKNWVLFPEKIDGKFAILHSITPNISIEYIENFEDLQTIDSHFAQTPRFDHWDNWMRGAGPPPIKTEDGWLLFYHAMDLNDPGKYKVGAMLLDLNDPSKILHRSKSPVLEPVADYENRGLKPGVIFATGALILDENIHVYYGSSDNTVSIAYYGLKEFLHRLKNHAAIKPSNVSINPVIHD